MFFLGDIVIINAFHLLKIICSFIGIPLQGEFIGSMFFFSPTLGSSLYKQIQDCLRVRYWQTCFVILIQFCFVLAFVRLHITLITDRGRPNTGTLLVIITSGSTEILTTNRGDPNLCMILKSAKYFCPLLICFGSWPYAKQSCFRHLTCSGSQWKRVVSCRVWWVRNTTFRADTSTHVCLIDTFYLLSKQTSIPFWVMLIVDETVPGDGLFLFQLVQADSRR